MAQRRGTAKNPGSHRRRRDDVPRESSKPQMDSDVVEGRNPVLEALRAGRPINKILIAQGVVQPAVVVEILRLAKEAGALVERVDRRAIDRLSTTGRSQGVVALVAVKTYANLDQLLEIGRIRGEPPLLILLDGIQDPHNLGAIIRTADGAGVHGVVIPGGRAAGLTASVARSSAGAVEHVPVARVGNLSNAMARLAKDNIWTVGIDPSGSSDYTEVDYRQATAIVVGAEGKGLSRLVKERCDILASVPMRGKVASLNASVAAALVMYEAMRQRNPSHS
ncbi:MAG: 23S rRNA (guanosine(2251)-2'-O)-methyltransferase RlmB [Dehalococcoidia bacterium]